MTATCRCPDADGYPCEALITQEDLLCDSCRRARQPGASCCAPLAIVPGQLMVHATLWLVPPEGA